MVEKKKLTWNERKKAEEMNTIVMEGPNKTNCWWRDKKKGKKNE